MPRSILIIIIFQLFLSYDCFKDQSPIQNENSQSERYNRLYKLTNHHITNSLNLDTTLSLAKETMALARKINNNKEILKSIYLLGKVYNHIGDFDRAEKTLKETIPKLVRQQYVEESLSILFELGRTQFFLLNYDEASSIFKEIELISNHSDLLSWKAIALDAIGAIYYVQSNFAEALKYHSKSLNLYRDLEDEKSISGLLYSIGADYNCLSIYDQAIEHYLKAVNKSEHLNDKRTLAMSLHAIGMTYQEIKNYSRSIEYNSQALILSNQIDDRYLTSSIFSNLGQVKFALAEYDSALFYFKEGLKIDEKLNFKPGIASALDNIGFIYIKLHDFPKSLNYFRKAYNLIYAINEKWRKTKILNHLGQYHLQESNYQISFEYINRSFKNSQSIKAQDLILENLNTFSEYYAATGNFKQAHKYLLRYSQLSDSIITFGSHNIAAMQLRYEMGKQEKEKQILRNKIQIQGLELEKVKLERWLSLLSIILFSLISFWSYNRYFIKKKANSILEKRIKSALKKQEEQQQIIFHQASLSSLGKLAAGMAHEINQPLQNLRLCAEYLDFTLRENHAAETLFRESIDEIYQDIERMKSIIDHVRLFSSQQKNQVEKTFQIKPIIINALAMISRQYAKKEIELKLDLKENLGQIKGNPFKLEQLIINILTNARDALLEKEKKTTEPFKKKIEISIIRKGSFIILRFVDNGIGLKSNQTKRIFRPFYTTKKLGKGTGLGLSIVQEIIEEFGGEKKVISEYMKGTVFEIYIPIQLKSRHTPSKKAENQRLKAVGNNGNDKKNGAS